MSKRYQGGILGVGFNPLQAPNAPTDVTATGGDAQATVSFTAPTNVGGSAITAYNVLSSPGGFTATGSASPITVTGLSNGTSYTFNVWALNSYGPSPAGGPSGSVTPAAPRGLFGGGNDGSSQVGTTDYITISTTANAIYFGDLGISRESLASCSSSTRGLFGGGTSPLGSPSNSIHFVTIASTGNGSSFGQLSVARDSLTGASSATRGLFYSGYGGGISSTIDYVTIASAGNATFFGNSSLARQWSGAGASPTRAVFGGGYTNAGTQSAVIDYVTIASTGNAVSFGNLSVARSGDAGCSSSTRAIFGGGRTTSGGGSQTARIDYVEIATTGNATIFGNLTVARIYIAACSSSTRGVFGGGFDGSAFVSTMDYVAIASTGNAASFGNLTVARAYLAGCSNGHGGL